MDTMLGILKYVQSFSNETLDSFFEIITMLGENGSSLFFSLFFFGVSIRALDINLHLFVLLVLLSIP